MNFEKPQGYDDVVVNDGDYTPIELGGHKLIIKKIEEVNKGDYKYLKIFFDTAPDDKQPNYYMDQYTNDTRGSKKWMGTATIFPTDKEGKTSKTFKQFCTSIERSNNSKIQWGTGFEGSVVNKVVGGIFGEEEYLNANNEVKTARKLFWWRSVDSIADAKIPDKRTVDKPSDGETGWMEIPAGIENDLPFK